jgi:hypothetical protein
MPHRGSSDALALDMDIEEIRPAVGRGALRPLQSRAGYSNSTIHGIRTTLS